jgi:hypothetical protein
MAGAGVFPKVTGDTIFFQDYNAIKSVIDGVVSTYYGNAITSSAVSQGTTITAAQMDLLRADINKAYTHITGSNSAINDLAIGGVIFKDDWNAYKTAADYCETNKDTVFAATQLGNAVLSTSLTADWNGAHTWTYTFTWPDAASANYYFNAGGYFVVDVSADGSTGSSKDNDWQNNILNAIASQTYANAQWDAGTNISVTEYGNVTQYLENYCQINITKTMLMSETKLVSEQHRMKTSAPMLILVLQDTSVKVLSQLHHRLHQTHLTGNQDQQFSLLITDN